MATSHAIASSPASPVGRKLTVGGESTIEAIYVYTYIYTQKRVEFDLYYIENWSVLFDLHILCRTPLALLKTENAY